MFEAFMHKWWWKPYLYNLDCLYIYREKNCEEIDMMRAVFKNEVII